MPRTRAVVVAVDGAAADSNDESRVNARQILAASIVLGIGLKQQPAAVQPSTIGFDMVTSSPHRTRPGHNDVCPLYVAITTRNTCDKNPTQVMIANLIKVGSWGCVG